MWYSNGSDKREKKMQNFKETVLNLELSLRHSQVHLLSNSLLGKSCCPGSMVVMAMESGGTFQRSLGGYTYACTHARAV